MTITLTLDSQEAQAILNVLGELPTKSGAFPLLQKLAEQVQSQTKEQSA
jgi:hypothetical protein